MMQAARPGKLNEWYAHSSRGVHQGPYRRRVLLWLINYSDFENWIKCDSVRSRLHMFGTKWHAFAFMSFGALNSSRYNVLFLGKNGEIYYISCSWPINQPWVLLNQGENYPCLKIWGLQRSPPVTRSGVKCRTWVVVGVWCLVFIRRILSARVGSNVKLGKFWTVHPEKKTWIFRKGVCLYRVIEVKEKN